MFSQITIYHFYTPRKTFSGREQKQIQIILDQIMRVIGILSFS